MTFQVRTRKSNHVDGLEYNISDLFERVEIQSKESQNNILNLMINDDIIGKKLEWLPESCITSFFEYVTDFKNSNI